MANTFKYIIFPEYTYKITVDDYDGNPYTFEVSGEEIAAHFRREKLLDRQMEELYNGSQEENNDR